MSLSILLLSIGRLSLLYHNGIIAVLAQVYCCLSTVLATLSTVRRMVLVLVLRRTGWNMVLRILYVGGRRTLRGGLVSYLVRSEYHYFNTPSLWQLLRYLLLIYLFFRRTVSGTLRSLAPPEDL